MQRICEDELCTGCCACLNICPPTAISMVKDDFGFNHPIIDNNKCIDCRLCKKVCPIINKPQLHKELITYAAISKDKCIYDKSTSGGIATTLSKYMILNGGVVYGAAFDEDFNLKHFRVDKIEKLSILQGSKYVQSFIGNNFLQIKRDLFQRKVLFIGTPCQVAGLLNYIPIKLHDNLITVSFICGGVPSLKFLKQHLSKWLDNAEYLRFRNGKEYGFWIGRKDHTLVHLDRFYSNYFRAFDNKISLRMACYNCQFACKDRVGDITIGDFWGLKEGQILKYNKNGVSIVMCSTDKGMNLMRSVQPYLFIEQHNINETLSMNPRLSTPSEISKEVWNFRNKYLITNDFDKSVDSVLRLKYTVYEIKRKLKKIAILNYLYFFLKKRKK